MLRRLDALWLSAALLTTPTFARAQNTPPPEEAPPGHSIGETPVQPAPVKPTPVHPAPVKPTPAWTPATRPGRPRLAPVPSSEPAPLGRHTLDVPMLPGAVLTDGHDRFYLVYRDRVLRVGRHVEGSYLFPVAATPRMVAVNQAGVVGTAVLASRSHCSRPGHCRRWYELLTVTCNAPGRCESRPQGRYPISKDSRTALIAATIDAEGRVAYGLRRTTCSGSGKQRRCSSHEIWRCGRRGCSRRAVEAARYAGQGITPRALVRCPPTGIRLRPGFFLRQGRRFPVEGPAMYQKTCQLDRLGRPHIVFHDPSSKSTTHAWLPAGATKPEAVTLFDRESGVYNALAALPDGGVAVFAYAYKNPFNKGLVASVLDRQGKDVDSFYVTRSMDDNPGWEVMAAASSTGRILLAYYGDARKKNAVVTIYDSWRAIKKHAPPDPQGWEKSYRNFFFLGGVGAFYPFWHVASLKPSKDDVPADRIFSADYSMSSTLVNSFKVEGRWGDFSFGLAYLRAFVGDKLEEAGGGLAAKAFDYFAGQIGWDRLVFYHDVRIEGAFSRVKGLYRDKNGRSADAIFSSDFTHIQLTLLNAYRIRYGLFYQSYDFHIPIYAYQVGAGDASYHFADSFTADVRFHDFGLTVGYSRLDYAAKYENQVFDWYIDGDIGAGVSIADLAESRQVAGQTIGLVPTFMIPFNLEVGLLAYKRWHRLYGFGGYVRLGYKLTGNFTGIAGKPDDRDEDDRDDADVTARYNRIALRHGPYLDIGLVF